MASIKVKFRLSSLDPKMGTIYYQIIHNRVVRQYKTDYHIFVHEWDTQKGDIIILPDSRQHIVQDISERIIWDVKNLQSIFRRFDAKKISYTVDDIIKSFSRRSDLLSLSYFMQDVINQLHNMGKCRTAETYRATLRSFMLFRKNKDTAMHSIDSDMMLMYEAYLHNRGLARNTTSFYMRILRAVYNRAVEKELIEDRHPFKHVYTGVDKTVKRAIPLGAIKQIKNLDLSEKPSKEFARDMFLFSFYTRGMSFIDIAHLRKKNLSFGALSYRRRKTGQQLNIRWEKCMQDIIDKYHTPHDSPYLLPILFLINISRKLQK